MPDDEDRQLRQLGDEVLKRGGLAVEQVNAPRDMVVGDVDDARVRTFEPVPAHRRVRQELSRGR